MLVPALCKVGREDAHKSHKNKNHINNYIMDTLNKNGQAGAGVLEKEFAAGTFQFRTPAGIQDFANDPDPDKQTAMNALWSSNLDGFTQQGMLSNPWNSTNTPPTTNYYNPVQNNPLSKAYNVKWSAFPGRLAFNFPTATQSQLNEMADTGQMQADISNNPCGSPTAQIAYFPYGPRGWQDEYCEWAVTRNTAGQITRIDFTCENPEYWNSLWLIDPNKVVELYQSILGKPQITLADLSLSGVTNPITQGPVYNPLNKWNSGTVSNDSQGGAIHLTSTPNTLQTEIGLATAASVQRNNPSGSTGNTVWPSSKYNTLLCDAQYGQKNRNSDPNIGGTVNNLVNGVLTNNVAQVATLADPPGLYIQLPNFQTYKTPDGTDPSSFWTIVRGSQTLNDQNGNQLPGNFILHAVYEVPSDKNYTVSDITIGGQSINWGSQVAATFNMQIVASAYASATQPQGYDAVGTPDAANTFAQPVQLFYEDYFNAMYNVMVPNPVNTPISLLSNSTFIPPVVFNSASGASMVLICATCNAVSNNPATYPTVDFDDPNITATVNSVQTGITYAVPGNSRPSNDYTALFITVAVGLNAASGAHGVYVTNPGQSPSAAMPALLTVAPTTVQANVKWQNTGVMVYPGSNVAISYLGGLWTANPHVGSLYNAAGNPYFIAAKPGYTLPGANEGMLVGRVGTTVFPIGISASVPPNLTGWLELCINDDLNGIYGAGFTDNIGSITVQIKVG
jgi:hypothetical protein